MKANHVLLAALLLVLTLSLSHAASASSGPRARLGAPDVPGPDLSTSAKSAPAAVQIGSTLAYTVSIRNTGGDVATSVRMTDTLPAGTSYVPGSLACTSGTCAEYSQGTIIWFGPVSAHDAVNVTFLVDTGSVACGGDIVNQAVIDAPGLPGMPMTLQARTSAWTELPPVLESFDGDLFPPAGWGQAPVTGIHTWTRVTTGMYPAIAPHSGPGMAQWNSYLFAPGDAARLASPALTLPGTGRPVLRLWMSHDAGLPLSDDRLQVQLSTDAGATWPVLLGTLHRYDVNCNPACWQEAAFDLTPFMGRANIRIGFLAISDMGLNFYLDDISISQPYARCPSVTLTPAEQSGSTCRGGDLTYSLVAANNSTVPDILDIGLSQPAAWPSFLTPDTLSLPAAGQAAITQTVHVPWTAGAGDFDAATVTAAGQATGLAGQAQTVSVAALAGSYVDHGDLPAAVRSRLHSVVYYNGALYKLGGELAGALDAVYAYDIATETWTQKAPLPAARYAFECGAIAGKIYCAGGYDTALASTLYVYDIAANAWSTGPNLPAGRFLYSGVVLGGKYYVLGGHDGAEYQNTVYVYDPAAGSWAELPSMAMAHSGAAAGAIGGKIYISGGESNGGGLTTVTEVYNPSTGYWTQVAPRPYAGQTSAADGVLHGRHLVVVGGYTVSGLPGNDVLAYDAVNNLWASQPAANHRVGGTAGGGDGAHFWYVSGQIYESGQWDSGRHATELVECAACVPVTGADFAWSPNTPAPGETVTFTATVGGGSPAITYAWDFGDGATSVGRVVTHTYAAGGAMTVTLTVINCDGASTVTVQHEVVVPLPAAGLALIMDDRVDPVIPGEALTYAITVTNTGPGTASNVVISDTLPAGFVFETWTISAGGCLAANGLLTCTVPGLPASGQVELEVGGHVDPDAECPGAIDNTAEVSSDNDDPNMADNRDSEATGVICGGTPALTLAPASLSLLVLQGAAAPVTQTLVISNTGTWRLNWDIVEWNPARAGYGTSAAYAAAHAPCDNASDIPWLSVAPGEGLTLPGQGSPVAVRFGDMNGLAAGIYPANLCVHSDDPARPLVTVPVTLTVAAPEADVSVTLADGPDPVLAGGVLTYTITLHNSGPQAATGVLVTDTLPAGVTFLSASAGCEHAAGTVMCTRASVAPGGSAQLRIVVAVDTRTPGPIVNTVTAAAAEHDPQAANNTAMTSTAKRFQIYLPAVLDVG